DLAVGNSFHIALPTEKFSGPGGNTSSPVIIPMAKSEVENIDKDMFNGMKDGKLTLEIPADKSEVRLPGNAAELLGTAGQLELKFGSATVSIPQSVLDALLQKLSEQERS